MGFFKDLGLDELFASVSELANEIDGLKKDIVSSIVEPATEFKASVEEDFNKGVVEPAAQLKETVNGIATSVSNKIPIK